MELQRLLFSCQHAAFLLLEVVEQLWGLRDLDIILYQSVVIWLAISVIHQVIALVAVILNSIPKVLIIWAHSLCRTASS